PHTGLFETCAAVMWKLELSNNGSGGISAELTGYQDDGTGFDIVEIVKYTNSGVFECTGRNTFELADPYTYPIPDAYDLPRSLCVVPYSAGWNHYCGDTNQAV